MLSQWAEGVRYVAGDSLSLYDIKTLILHINAEESAGLKLLAVLFIQSSRA